MTMIEQPKQRVWINVATSTKWVHTYEVTVENLGATPEELREAGDAALAESDRLVAELDRKYQPPFATARTPARARGRLSSLAPRPPSATGSTGRRRNRSFTTR